MTKNNHIKSDNENGISYLKVALKAAISQVMNGEENDVILKGMCTETIVYTLQDMEFDILPIKWTEREKQIIVMIATDVLKITLNAFSGKAIVVRKFIDSNDEEN